MIEQKQDGAGAPRRNKNARGKRVDRDRIAVNLSISKRNGLLDLSSDFLFRQGIDPTGDNIRTHAADWFYLQYGQWLKRQIEMQDQAVDDL